MIAFGRLVGAFSLMMAVVYLGLVVFFPAPPRVDWRPDDMTGASAATRLSQEAQALVSRKPAATLQ